MQRLPAVFLLLFASFLACVLVPGVPPVWAQSKPDLVWVRGAHASDVYCSVYSPDGRFFVSGSKDGTFKIWRLSDGMLLHTIPESGVAFFLRAVFSPDSKTVVLSDGTATARLHRISDAGLIHSVTVAGDAITSIALSPDGQILATGTKSGKAYLWDVRSGSALGAIAAQTNRVTSLTFSPDGRSLATVSGDRDNGSVETVDTTIHVWDVATRTLNWADPGAAVAVAADASVNNKVDYSADGNTLIVTRADKLFSVWLYRATNGVFVNRYSLGQRTLTGNAGLVNGCLYFSSIRSESGSTQVIAIGEFTGKLFRFSNTTTNSLQLIGSFGPGHYSWSVAWSPGGRYLAICEMDTNDGGYTVVFFDSGNGKLVGELTAPGATGSLHCLAISGNGEAVASWVRNHGRANVRRPADGTVLSSISTLFGDIALSPDGKTLAGVYDNGSPGSIGLWRVSDGTLLRTFSTNDPGLGTLARGIAFSADGSLLVYGSQQALRVWRVSDGSLVKMLPGVTGKVAISPDGSLVAVGADSVSLYRTSDWTIVRTINTPRASTNSLSFSVDGKMLAVAQDVLSGGQAVVHDVASGAPLLTVPSNSSVRSAAISPDGNVLAVGIADHHLALWSIPGRSRLSDYTDDANQSIQGVLYSPDGRFLYYGRGDGTICSALNPYFNTIMPNHGGNTGNVTVQVVTSPEFRLSTNAVTEVRLVADGQPDIIGQNTTVKSDQWLTTAFDLRDVPLGERSVVVTAAGKTWRQARAFTVETSLAWHLDVQIAGRSRVRGGVPEYNIFLFTNQSNVDTIPTTAWLGVESFLNVATNEPIIEKIPSESTLFYALNTPVIPAGATFSVPLIISDPKPQGHRTYNIAAWVNWPFTTWNNLIPLARPPQPPPPSPPIPGNICDFMFEYIPEDFADVCGPDGPCELQYEEMIDAWFDAWLKADAATQACNRHADQATAIVTKTYAILAATLAEEAIFDIFLEGLSETEAALLEATFETAVKLIHDLVNAIPDWEKMKGIAEQAQKEILSTITLIGVHPRLNDLVNLAEQLDLGADLDKEDKLRDSAEMAMLAFRDAESSFTKKLVAYRKCLEANKCGPVISVEELVAGDPNELTGTLGYGDARWTSDRVPLMYGVFFENIRDATAPAAHVVTTTHLDAAALDLTTLSLRNISFGDRTVTPTVESSPPAGLKEFDALVDLRPQKNLLVRVYVKADLLTGDLTWAFTSLDPNTLQPPTDPLAGFLDPGVGGSCLFSVMPKKGVPTGTVVQNQATIVFDFNDPMDTNTWLNTIDADKPTSRVGNLAATQNQAQFTVQWQASDVGSGVRDVSVLVSDNGGRFAAWLSNTTDTQATFTGVPGHTYAFKSVARDNVLNQEDDHGQADATTKIADGATDVTTQVKVAQGGFRRNRATGRYQQEVTLTNTGATTVAGPISLVADNLPAGVTLFGATGKTVGMAPLGSPYLNAASSSLAPGGSVKVVLEFVNSGNVAIAYSPRVLAGPGLR